MFIWTFPDLILFSPIYMTNSILEYTFFKLIWPMSYLIMPNWPLMTKFTFQVVLLKFVWPNAILVLFQINPYLIMLNWSIIELSWGLYYQIHTWIYFPEVCMTIFMDEQVFLMYVQPFPYLILLSNLYDQFHM